MSNSPSRQRHRREGRAVHLGSHAFVADLAATPKHIPSRVLGSPGVRLGGHLVIPAQTLRAEVPRGRGVRARLRVELHAHATSPAGSSGCPAPSRSQATRTLRWILRWITRRRLRVSLVAREEVRARRTERIVDQLGDAELWGQRPWREQPLDGVSGLLSVWATPRCGPHRRPVWATPSPGVGRTVAVRWQRAWPHAHAAWREDPA